MEGKPQATDERPADAKPGYFVKIEAMMYDDEGYRIDDGNQRWYGWETKLDANVFRLGLIEAIKGFIIELNLEAANKGGSPEVPRPHGTPTS